MPGRGGSGGTQEKGWRRRRRSDKARPRRAANGAPADMPQTSPSAERWPRIEGSDAVGRVGCRVGGWAHYTESLAFIVPLGDDDSDSNSDCFGGSKQLGTRPPEKCCT
jgi:hypothetical protein